MRHKSSAGVFTLFVALLTIGPCGWCRASLLDNFNAENGGVGVLNYTGFANWNPPFRGSTVQ